MSLIFLLLSAIVYRAQGLVPKDQTFVFTNNDTNGYLKYKETEYGGSYRYINIPGADAFSLRIYNTTNNAFTLAIAMGTQRDDSLINWVWEANRGNPVGENATLTFGIDGNLVLADANGRIAWQTNTANKGVVGIKLLPNGSMVLYNKKGKYVWQSFDYPTDTLLVGQSLKLGGVTKLVSRASVKNNVNGPYSLVMDTSLGLFYNSPITQKPLKYCEFGITNTTFLQYVRFETDLKLTYQYVGSEKQSKSLDKARYNTTFSYLRLEIDGNLRVHTYDYDDDWKPWQVTASVFSRESIWQSECKYPGKCGNFGLCENNQCVACPTSKGLIGWSKDCKPEKVTSCNVKDFHYYKIDKSVHIVPVDLQGQTFMKLDACRNKCSEDCKCLGFTYNTYGGVCWIYHDLSIIETNESLTTSTTYIKAPNKSIA